jgi:hypothetical protein
MRSGIQYVGLFASSQETKRLADALASELRTRFQVDVAKAYPVRRNDKNICHVTIAHAVDCGGQQGIASVVRDTYRELLGKTVHVTVTGYAMDARCVALTVEVPSEIPVFPSDKACHITMLLNGREPKYSNALIGRLRRQTKFHHGEHLVTLEEPWTATLHLDTFP